MLMAEITWLERLLIILHQWDSNWCSDANAYITNDGIHLTIPTLFPKTITRC